MPGRHEWIEGGEREERVCRCREGARREEREREGGRDNRDTQRRRGMKIVHVCCGVLDF